MEIRTPETGEREIVWTELLVPGFRATEAVDPEFDELDEEGLEEMDCGYWLDDDEKVLFVAEVDGELVGYLSAGVFQNAPIYTRGARTHIDGLYVKPRYRRQNVASALVQHAKEWGERRDCDYFGVTVHHDNEAARKLYEDQSTSSTSATDSNSKTAKAGRPLLSVSHSRRTTSVSPLQIDEPTGVVR